ncbi:MAG: germination protein YpeB [Halanaerobiaceae bacterium]
MVALLVVAGTALWGYNQHSQNQRMQTYLGNRYQRAFYRMVDNVEQVQILLGKTLASGSPSQNIDNLTKVWRHSDNAQSELANLPLSQSTAYRSSKFLNQMGDYAHVIARKNSRGEVLSRENREQLAALRGQAAELSQALHEIETRVFAGNVSWGELVRGAEEDMDEELEDPFSDGFDDIKEDLEKYPTLIYDGPFSDHMTQTNPRGLQGEEISQDQAREKAQEVVDFRERDQEDIEVDDNGTIEGRVPAYSFKVGPEDGSRYSVDISKRGGFLSSMLLSRRVEGKNIDRNAAAEEVEEYLEEAGYEDMESTYSEVSDNIAYISYAYKPEDVIYYPDIINVQVGLDNGQIMGVEAMSYLMSHRSRDLQEPELTEEEVEEIASDQYDSIEGIRLALIPKDSMQEELTYEVQGSRGEEKYLIYINARTGDEEQILRIVEEDNGTFTI